MNTICKRMIWAATLAGGLIAATAGAASASSDGPLGHLLGGSGSGTEISVGVPVVGLQADVTVGPKTSVEVGPSHHSHSAQSQGTKSHVVKVRPRSAVGDVTVKPKIEIPVDVRNVAVGIGGHAKSSSPKAEAPKAETPKAEAPKAEKSHHSGKGRLVGDVNVSPEVKVPVHVGGVALGVLGNADATDAPAPAAPSTTTSTTSTSPTTPATSATSSLLGDVTVSPLVDVPINLCGVAAGVLGDASATCPAHVPTTPASSGVNVPIDICGIGLGVLGDASASCGGTTTTPPTTTPPTTTPPTTTPSETDPTTPPSTTPPATTPPATTPPVSTPAENAGGTSGGARGGTSGGTAANGDGGSVTVSVGGTSEGAGSARADRDDVCLNTGLMTAGLNGGGSWMTQLITLLGGALGAFFLGMTVRTPGRRARA